MIDTARYILAVYILLITPIIIVFWFLIHPFAKLWRGIRPWFTYGFLFTLILSLIFKLYPFRAYLIGTDYGFKPILAIVGAIFTFSAFMIYLRRRKYLTKKILLGYPEVSKEAYPGNLLTKGIYGKIRHPRYVEIELSIIGYSLFANFLGAYLMTMFLILALYVIALVEEKELMKRFGKDYGEYRQKVPRFIPKILFSNKKDLLDIK